jgi:hypothetical protein
MGAGRAPSLKLLVYKPTQVVSTERCQLDSAEAAPLKKGCPQDVQALSPSVRRQPPCMVHVLIEAAKLVFDGISDVALNQHAGLA